MSCTSHITVGPGVESKSMGFDKILEPSNVLADHHSERNIKPIAMTWLCVL